VALGREPVIRAADDAYMVDRAVSCTGVIGDQVSRPKPAGSQQSRLLGLSADLPSGTEREESEVVPVI
jgi:hypothetical protein